MHQNNFRSNNIGARRAETKSEAKALFSFTQNSKTFQDFPHHIEFYGTYGALNIYIYKNN